MTTPNPTGAVHPGEVLSDVLDHMEGVGKGAVAEALGISRMALNKLENGRMPVSAGMALRLGKYFGNGPQFWLNLQNNYDLARAQAELKDELERIPVHRSPSAP